MKKEQKEKKSAQPASKGLIMGVLVLLLIAALLILGAFVLQKKGDKELAGGLGILATEVKDTSDKADKAMAKAVEAEKSAKAAEDKAEVGLNLAHVVFGMGLETKAMAAMALGKAEKALSGLAELGLCLAELEAECCSERELPTPAPEPAPEPKPEPEPAEPKPEPAKVKPTKAEKPKPAASTTRTVEVNRSVTVVKGEKAEKILLDSLTAETRGEKGVVINAPVEVNL